MTITVKYTLTYTISYNVTFAFFVKNFDFGKRITGFRRYFIRKEVEQSWYVESVGFCLNNVIKSIDKLCCLRKVDCEIYIRSSYGLQIVQI